MTNVGSCPYPRPKFRRDRANHHQLSRRPPGARYWALSGIFRYILLRCLRTPCGLIWQSALVDRQSGIGPIEPEKMAHEYPIHKVTICRYIWLQIICAIHSRTETTHRFRVHALLQSPLTASESTYCFESTHSFKILPLRRKPSGEQSTIRSIERWSTACPPLDRSETG